MSFSQIFTEPRLRGTPADQLRLLVVLTSVFMILLAVLVASNRGVWAPDELRYAQIIRNMERLEDFFVLRLWGGVYTEKPPLFFWLTRAVEPLTGGVYLSTLLIPIVPASCLVLWLTGRIASEWFGDCAGIAAVLLLASLPLFLLLSSIGRMDMLLTLCMTASVAALYRGYAEGRRWAKVGAFMWIGLGLLAKGPFGVLIPLLVGITALIRAGQVRRLWCWETLLGLVVMTAIPCVWLGPAFYFAGFDYLHELIGKQVVRRAMDGVDHAEPIYFYLWVLPILLLPWVIIIGPAVRSTWRCWRASGEPVNVWILSWVFVPILVLTLVREKLPIYLLPLMPPVAILMGRYWGVLLTQGGVTSLIRLRMGWLFLVASMLGITAILAALVIWQSSTEPGVVRFGNLCSIQRHDEITTLLLQPSTLLFGGSLLFLLSLVGWATMWVPHRYRLVGSFATLAAIAPCGQVFLVLQVMPSLDPGQSWRAAADAISSLQSTHESVAIYGLRPFAAYYLNQEVSWFRKHNSLDEFVRERGSVWCATLEGEIEEIERYCVVQRDPDKWYPSPSGPVRLLRLSSLAVAEKEEVYRR